MIVRRKTKLFTVAILLALFLTMVLSVVPAFACGGCDDPGTGTPGYWKNHPEAWPVGVEIGGVWYTKAEAIDWLKTPVKGDKSITMFKALVAAKLNFFIGNCNCIEETIIDADGWMKKFPVGSDVPGRSEAWQYSHGEALYWTMDAYNNGLLCSPPRD